MAIMEFRHIGIEFGGLKAVSDFNLTLEKGELVAIIGPNGAGKTTIFNLITGIYKPTTGDILLDGESLVGKKPYQFNQRGIARTFQNIRLFDEATVLDNLIMAMDAKAQYSIISAMLRTPGFMATERVIRDEAYAMLEQFGLDEKADMMAGKLPYGEQRKVEMARAMVTSPKVLLLDEPVAGMNSSEIDDFIHLIPIIREKFDVTILFIEHHMHLVMSIADRIKVLDFGETIAEGTPQEVQNDPKVIEAYLGGDSEDV